jgi:hypothetical protein
MQKVPWLDPGGFQGRFVGAAMTAAWCAGLGVLILGIVRQHASRFTLRSLLMLIAAIAIFLGACQAVHPVVPTMSVAATLSVAMLYEAQRLERRPYRGWISRVIMAVGGSLFLAHAIRILGYMAAMRLGVLRR